MKYVLMLLAGLLLTSCEAKTSATTTHQPAPVVEQVARYRVTVFSHGIIAKTWGNCTRSGRYAGMFDSRGAGWTTFRDSLGREVCIIGESIVEEQ